ncbi:MAG TPA: CPBP family intramembrane glutamic endopeptidase [Chloroflexia bacterium]|nr:CPBP family intramembrane glutamic endopeptidase [Chloroflexia bacterium]
MDDRPQTTDGRGISLPSSWAGRLSSVFHKAPDYEPLLLAALLLAYSNGMTALAYRGGRDPERTYLFANPAVLLTMLLYALKRAGGLRAVGLRRDGLVGSVAQGLGLGGLLSLVPILFFRRPVLLDTPLEFGPVANMSKRGLLLDVGMRVPVNIALMEEVAFRGLLYDALRMRYSERMAVVGSALVFAGWHFAVTYASVRQTNLAMSARLPTPLQPLVQPIAVLGGMVSTGLAGAAFALLRRHTDNLAGPVAAHWLLDSLLIASLWYTSPRRK